MKKSIKILGLVLSLALICGALVVAAFAADGEITGITEIDSLDFQDKSEEVYAQANSAASETKLGKAFLTCYKGRYGQPSVVTSEYDSNNYLVWTLNTDYSVNNGNPTNQWGGAGYFYAYLAPTPTLSGGIPVVDSVKNYSYYVVDVDFRSPNGIVPHKMNVQFLHRYLKADGSGHTLDSALDADVSLQMKDGKVSIFDNNDLSTQTVVDNTQWTHLTFILETNLNDDGSYSTVHHVYLNGKHAWTLTGETKVDASAYYNGTFDSLSCNELRVNFPGTLDQAGLCDKNDAGQQTEWETVAFDNVVLRKISVDSNTNLGEVIATKSDITNWDSNVYDASAMPFGVPAAKNVDTEKVYDSLQKAIDDASEGDTIELLADAASKVYVENTLQIDSKGFKCDVEGVKPFTYTEENGVYYFEESATALTVIWGSCGHVDGCEDETHPGGIETEVLLNANIYNSYTKDHNWSYSDDEAGILYTLTGWEIGDTGELLSADAKVDEALLEEGLLELYPVISTATYAYEYVNNSGETVKEYDTVELKSIIAKAKKGTTVKLLNDVAMNSQVVVGYDIILDLNGYTLDNIQPSSVSKYATFSVSSNVSFKLTTSRPGAKVFTGHDNRTSFNGNAFIQASKGSTVTIDGSKGLQVWTVVVYMTYGNAAGTLYINGGEYYDPKSIGDQDSFLQIDTTEYVELKNAMFWADRGILGFGGGGYTEYPTEAAKVVIDNCTFLSNTVIQRSNKYIDVIITNSYLGGSLNASSVGPTRSGCLASVAGGTWTLGEGNYIATGATMSDNVVVKEGLVSHNVNLPKTFVVTMNTFTNNDREASKVLTTTKESYSFGTYIGVPAQPVQVTWYDTDGTTVLGVTEHTLPGTAALAPAIPVAEIDGWLNATYNQWTNPDGVETTVVPAGVTEYSFKLVEGAEVVYTAGIVPVYINYSLVLHIQLNIYVPKNAPEGITIKGTDYVAPKSSGSNLQASGTYIINGDEYGAISRWPCAAQADDDATIAVTFEYEGKTYTYTTPAYNIGNYAKVIFSGDYSMEIKQATLSALEYIEAANKASNATATPDVIKAIADAYAAGITVEIPDLEAGDAIDESAVKDYIDSIQVAYNSSNGGIQFRFYKTQKAIDDAATVVVTWNGHSTATGTTDATSGKYPQTTNEYGKAFWYTHGTNAYDFDGVFTIEVRVGGAAVATIEYSLEAYAAAVKEDCTDVQWELLMTTLAFGKYAEVVKK